MVMVMVIHKVMLIRLLGLGLGLGLDLGFVDGERGIDCDFLREVHGA